MLSMPFVLCALQNAIKATSPSQIDEFFTLYLKKLGSGLR
jgi:hypothetical protein